jgi:hypothetical protein
VTDEIPEDRFLHPGTKVRLDSLVNDNDEVTSEYGVVVHCWQDQELGFHNCYVAFFGDAMPSGQPAEKPYVLRYAAISLTPLS